MTPNAAPAPMRASAVTVEARTQILPGRGRSAAVISFTPVKPGRPVIWGIPELAALEEALDRVDPQDVEALILIGAEASFGAGADLDAVRAAMTASEAEDLARYGYRIFNKVSSSAIPSFALITGTALGGGLELALHASHRLARSDAKALGLPETGLGLVPGWGGTYLLPHLIGPSAALKIITLDPLRSGRTLTPDEAWDLGIVDDVIAAEAWDERWPAWVAEQLDSPAPCRRVHSAADWAAAVKEARQKADRYFHGAAPAPLAAIDLVEGAEKSTPEEAMEAAVQAFGQLTISAQASASLYAHELIAGMEKRTRAASGAAAPHAFRSAAVIGAGLMAGQLAALIAAEAGIPVRMTDIDEERLAAGVSRVHTGFTAQARKGMITAAEAERWTSLITAAPHVSDLAECDFIIEAVFENLEVKKAVFADLEDVVSPTAVLATNTSSLSISEIASGLHHPERVVGFHVFNPVGIVRLVEIIPGDATDPGTIDRALSFATELDRVPVRVADKPGFAVNRLLTRMFDVILHAIDAGTEPEGADRCLDSLGLPMSPLRLLDFVGPAIQLHVCETMHAAYPERFGVPGWLKAVVDHGLSRVLSPDGTLTGEARDLLVAVRSRTSQGQPLPAPLSLTESVLDALTQETRIMLDEGVVDGLSDIDLCMILGANYPLYLGGLTPLLDYSGSSERAAGALFHTYH